MPTAGWGSRPQPAPSGCSVRRNQRPGTLQQRAKQVSFTSRAVPLIPRHVHAVLAPLGEDWNQSLPGVPPRLTLKPPPVSVSPAAQAGELKLKAALASTGVTVFTVVQV